jgi:RNA polymerase sigma-70 factor, ECF subfamily
MSAEDISGDLQRLLPLMYDELRRLAEVHMSRERPDHTLQPTALVHEAFIRMAPQFRVVYQGRTHFLAMASAVMRRVLVDHARARAAGKREGGWEKITLVETVGSISEPAIDLLALDQALEKLAAADPISAEIVQLRFFGGLTEVEAGEVLGISERSVRGYWAHARAWLRRELAGHNQA